MKIYIFREGKRQGPFTQDQVRKNLLKGDMKPKTLAWHSAIPEWISLQELTAGLDVGAQQNEVDASAEAYTMPDLPPQALQRRYRVRRTKERPLQPLRDWFFRLLRVAR